MSKYFVCSIGQPGMGYDDENLRRCVINKAYFLNSGATQWGSIEEILPEDVLILKFKGELIGYGRATQALQKEEETANNQGWIYRIPVAFWILGNRVPLSGVYDAQLSGTNYDAVKEVNPSFALEKLEKIGFSF